MCRLSAPRQPKRCPREGPPPPPEPNHRITGWGENQPQTPATVGYRPEDLPVTQAPRSRIHPAAGLHMVLLLLLLLLYPSALAAPSTQAEAAPERRRSLQAISPAEATHNTSAGDHPPWLTGPYVQSEKWVNVRMFKAGSTFISNFLTGHCQVGRPRWCSPYPYGVGRTSRCPAY